MLHQLFISYEALLAGTSLLFLFALPHKFIDIKGHWTHSWSTCVDGGVCVLSQAALEVQLKEFGLEATGNKESLISRLLGAYTQQQALESQDSAATNSKVVTTGDLFFSNQDSFSNSALLQANTSVHGTCCVKLSTFPELPCTCRRWRMRRLLGKCTFFVARLPTCSRSWQP